MDTNSNQAGNEAFFNKWREHVEVFRSFPFSTFMSYHDIARQSRSSKTAEQSIQETI